LIIIGANFMGDIFLTCEEVEFRQRVREFCKREIAPLSDLIEKMGDYPREILRKMGREGFLKVHHRVESGGTGKGLSYEVILAEEVSAVSASTEMSRLASVTLYGMPVSRFGTIEQKRTYLAPVLLGEKIGALGITEPDVGSDVAGMKTRAEKDGEDYSINGEKRFITNGSIADFLVVFAITNPEAHAHKGMSAFIVESSQPGFEVVKDFELMGMRGARVAHLKFNNLRVPNENLLGKENAGFSVLMDELDSERTAIAAGMVGTARAAYEVAVKYSTDRVQFDVPIRQFEGVSFKVAEMAVKIEAARLLTLRAARMIDNGSRATKEAAMAKLYATEAAVDVTNDALQVLGGIGYSKEYPVERYVRDARLMTIGGGTSEIMKYLIQREVYKEFGL